MSYADSRRGEPRIHVEEGLVTRWSGIGRAGSGGLATGCDPVSKVADSKGDTAGPDAKAR